MLSWLFKKRGPIAAPAAPPANGATPTTGRAAAAPAGTAKKPSPVVDEGPLLRAALGDDAALLRLAQSALQLDTKLAAVEALADEGALRQAERSFRSHDRKVHRLAKQRLQAAVTRREAQAQALALLERTRGLMADALAPVNHLVEVDRAWAALPAQALPPELQQAWTTLRAELDAQMRAQDDAQRRLQRWTAEARRQLDAAAARKLAAAEQGGAQDVARLADALAALRATRPDVPATSALDDALAQLQQAAAASQTQHEEKAAAAMFAPAVTTVVAELGPAAELPPAPAPKDEARLAAQRLLLEGLVQQAEDAVAEGQLALLQQRLQAIEACLAQEPAAPPVALRARLQALRAELGRLKAWQQWGGARARDDLVIEAEALARLPLVAAAQAAQAAQDAQDVLGAPGASQAADSPDAPELPQEPLVPEAEEAEKAEAAAEANEAAASAEPQLAETGEGTEPTEPLPAPPAPPARPAPPAPATTQGGRTPRPAAPRGKLNLKQHAQAIQSLRLRWKALDHQGAVASAEQWRRFDAALQLAHEPVAEQQAALKAARLENLAAREALLSALEAWPGVAAPAGAGVPLTDAPEVTAGNVAPDWRAVAAELDRFQAAWRKLGPVEHTVPAAARDALLRRLNTAMACIEGPLQQARAAAAAEREQLIAQAERLLSPAGARPAPESTRQVRELQAAWQEHARRLPLPRGLETTLWARFKAATDAVFTQRESAFAARDAELTANLAAANALVDRLAALDTRSPPTEIQRTLGEVDRAWRQGGEVPRGAVDALEARFHAARDAASELLDACQQQRWQARCDALAARLALCEAREDSAANTDALNARWAEPDAVPGGLPTQWQQALATRWGAPPGAGPLRSAEVDDLLLRLEAALEVPTAPAWQAARQQLKLRTLKDTMEGRAPVHDSRQQGAGTLRSLLRQAGLDAAQRTRLQALLAALRAAQPAVLGLPAEKA